MNVDITKTQVPETKEQETTTPDISSEEKDLTTLKTDVDTTVLKNAVETSTDKTILTYIKDTEMYTKLDTLQKSWELPGFTIEKFASDINTTVEKYLKEVFSAAWTEKKLTVSDTVLSSLSIGIQFSMMEALTKSWAGGADFFTTFSETKTESASSAFTGLTKAFWSEWLLWKVFGGVGKTNEFYSLAKKVENCIDFVGRYCGEWKELGDGTKVDKLANANEFRKLLSISTWGDDAALLKKTPKDLWLTVSDKETAVMSDADKAELKKIADNTNMPINAKTVKAIMAALPTAQSFLEKRAWYKNQAVDLMSTVSWFLDINIFGLGSLWSIIWITNPVNIFRGKDGKKKWWVMNFVLKAMWFHNGIEWLYQEYTKQMIDKNLTADGKQFIKDTLTDYTALVAWTYTGTKTIDTLWLTALDATLQAKIPSQYDDMKKVLYENISGKETSLNIGVLTSLWVTVETKVDDTWNKVIDEEKFDKTRITEDVMDKYLKLTIPTLAANTDFMTGIKTSDEFMLSLAWWLICGSCFASWVALGMETIAQYKETTDKDTTTEWKVDVINGKIDFSKWNFTEVEKKNINFLIDEMTKAWIKDVYTQIGILSVISKESGFVPQSEYSYSTTPNVNLRKKFGSRVTLSDSELDELKKKWEKAFDETFFDMVYGKDATKALWWATGNDSVGDGYKYRGRWYNQLTFKASYKKYGDKIGEDLVTNPDRLNDSVVAAKVALAFFTDWNKWKDLSTLTFTDKTTAAKFFSDINAGGIDTGYSSKAILASAKFNVQENIA